MVSGLATDGENNFASIEHPQPMIIKRVRAQMVHARQKRVARKNDAETEYMWCQPVRAKTRVVGKRAEYGRAIHAHDARHKYRWLILWRLKGAAKPDAFGHIV